MPPEMKKRSVLERLKEKYFRAARTKRHQNQEHVPIELFLSDFPRALNLTLAELGALLLQIENEYGNKKVAVGVLNNGSTRRRNNFYPVRVSSSAFLAELISKVKPTITEHDNFWCIILPGQKNITPIGRVGSLKGELFSILGKRLGQIQSVDHVLEELNKRVKDRRTQNPDMREIKNGLREINVTMHSAIQKRLKLLDDRNQNVLAVFRKRMPWTAELVMRSSGSAVGIR